MSSISNITIQTILDQRREHMLPVVDINYIILFICLFSNPIHKNIQKNII